MEYTNDMIHKMHALKSYNNLYSDYFVTMGNVFKDDQLDNLGNGIKSRFLINRGLRLKECLNYWEWDKYRKNKLLDLQRVERCKDNNFCPNCRILSVSKDLLAMKNFYSLNANKYDFYLLTLTVPNIYPDSDDFRNRESDIKFAKRFNDHVDKLYETFKNFSLKYCSADQSKHSYDMRSFKIVGGIRTLEITYSKGRSGSHYNKYGFHPHLHCLIYIDKGVIPDEDLEKRYRGKWSDKKLREYCDQNNIIYDDLHMTDKERLIKSQNLYNYKSLIDNEIGAVWSMLWNGDSINSKKMNSISYHPDRRFLWQDGAETNVKALEVDCRKLQDEKGIYEAIKYTFKLKDFKNLFEFSQMVFVLQNRRLRQKFGELYKMDLDNFLDKTEIPLELEILEEASKLYLRDISELYDFEDYRKISRFKNKIDKNLIDTL